MSNIWFKAITFTCIALLLIGGIYTVNRLNVVEADLRIHVEYLRSLKGLIFCYHPDTTIPDPNTTGHGIEIKSIPGGEAIEIIPTPGGKALEVIGDKFIDPDTMPAIDYPQLDTSKQWIEDNLNADDIGRDTITIDSIRITSPPNSGKYKMVYKRDGMLKYWFDSTANKWRIVKIPSPSYKEPPPPNDSTWINGKWIYRHVIPDEKPKPETKDNWRDKYDSVRKILVIPLYPPLDKKPPLPIMP